MGGRDNYILIIVSLVDRDGTIIKDRKVPIHMKLLYDNEDRAPVTKQGIFRPIGTSCKFIDPATGKSTLQFRIEDVSRNHQGLNFIIEVGTDMSKFPDIAPAYSRSVCIRSKKTRLKRKRDNQTVSPNRRAALPTFSARSPPSRFPPPLSYPNSTGYFQNAHQVRHAMRGVIEWTEAVVNGLGPLKWDVMGYGQNPDGSIDYNRPYHQMKNPNEKVNEILDMYTHETRGHLHTLLHAVEQSINPSKPEYMCVGAVLPPHGVTPHLSNPLRPEMRQLHQHSYHQEYSRAPHSIKPIRLSREIEHRNRAQNHSQGVPPVEQGAHPPPLQRVPHSEETRASNAEYDISETTDTQTDVHYILATTFNSIRTDQLLGLPAFDIKAQLVGFYRESNIGNGARFISIQKHKNDFDIDELEHASRILKQALVNRSQIVYTLKDWGCLKSMVGHALMSDGDSTET